MRINSYVLLPGTSDQLPPLEQRVQQEDAGHLIQEHTVVHPVILTGRKYEYKLIKTLFNEMNNLNAPIATCAE